MEQQSEITWQGMLKLIVCTLLAIALFLTPWYRDKFMGWSLAEVAKAAAILAAAPLILINLPNRGLFAGPELWAVLLAFWAIVRSLFVQIPEAGYSGAKEYVTALLSFVVVSVMGLTRKGIAIIVIGLVAGGIFSVGQMYSGVAAKGGVEYIRVRDAERFSVSGYNANHPAYCFATGAAMLAAMWMSRRKDTVVGVAGKSVLAGAIVVLAAGILLAGTRGAMLSMGAVLVVLFFGQVLARSVSGAAMAVFGTVGVVMLVSMMPVLLDRFAMKSNWDTGRWKVWGRAVEVVVEEPFVGVGPGQFPFVSSAGIYPHNGVLGVATELGVPGLAVYMLILAMILLETIRTRSFLIALPVFVAWGPLFMTGVWERQLVAWVAFGVVLAYARLQEPVAPAWDPARLQMAAANGYAGQGW